MQPLGPEPSPLDVQLSKYTNTYKCQPIITMTECATSTKNVARIHDVPPLIQLVVGTWYSSSSSTVGTLTTINRGLPARDGKNLLPRITMIRRNEA